MKEEGVMAKKVIDLTMGRASYRIKNGKGHNYCR